MYKMEESPMEERKRLPDSELDIMLAVWRIDGKATAPQILEALKRPLTAGALHTYLKRLEEKGFLSREKVGKTNCYTALVRRGDYEGSEGRAVLDKLYGKSLGRFATALYDGGKLTREDVEELREFLDGVEEWMLE